MGFFFFIDTAKNRYPQKIQLYRDILSDSKSAYQFFPKCTITINTLLKLARSTVLPPITLHYCNYIVSKLNILWEVWQYTITQNVYSYYQKWLQISLIFLHLMSDAFNLSQ